MNKNYFIGVDVGSGSVRAGLFDEEGNAVSITTAPIKTRSPAVDFFEQSSDDIVVAICICIKEIVSLTTISINDMRAIVFDATCSLVCIDRKDNPVSINEDKDDYWNIIMWMDHRAKLETKKINDLGHSVLNYVGSKMSVEMEIPKIKWLKNNLPEQYNKTAKFLDLADFLQYKFSGVEIRSTCTVACKWTYLAHEKKWSRDFFEQCDLEDLLDNRIGTECAAPGEVAGNILEKWARELGLSHDTIIGVGIIDAHAGVLGASGGSIENKMIIIGGTSNCHMYNSKKKYFIEGIWGPYYDVIASAYWLNEGGQSAAGALIDKVIKNHGSYHTLMDSLKDLSIYEFLNEKVSQMKKNNPYTIQDIHILDYHHGNRSPRANNELRGMVSGLTLNDDEESLVMLYWATIQSVCYGTRHIIDTCIKGGAKIDSIAVCGGILKNPIWLQELADICQMPLEITKEQESMLLGSAILAAKASGVYASIEEAMQGMSKKSHTIVPNIALSDFHDKKYKVYLEMYEDQEKYKRMMKMS